MPFKIITVPFDSTREVFMEETLNTFCLNKKVLSWHPGFFTDRQKPYWTIFIEFEEVLEAEPTEDSLSEPEKLLLKRLREWRRARAQDDGVPVFIIATNSELRGVVRHAPRSLEALKSVRGFGKRKLEKYGKEIVGLVRAFHGDEQ